MRKNSFMITKTYSVRRRFFVRDKSRRWIGKYKVSTGPIVFRQGAIYAGSQRRAKDFIDRQFADF